MNTYLQLRKRWQDNGFDLKIRMIKWRREPATIRIEKPTRLDRARSLGYKAKKGIFIVRQKVLRGGHTKSLLKGRRTRRRSKTLNLMKNYQSIAEERAVKHYKNCEVLNSYYVAQDGKQYWYEIIMADRTQYGLPKGKAFRGLTSAGKKSRGLRRKGIGAEQVR